MSEPLAGTESAAKSITRVKYTHDAMIDLIIQNPGVPQGVIARHFNYTETWVSRVLNSDAFQARLAVRKEDLVDPSIILTVEEKFKTLANRSLDIIQEKLEQTKSVDVAFKGLELATKALGYGARKENVNVQQNFVVAMPAQIDDAKTWAAAHQTNLGVVVDVTPKMTMLVPQEGVVGLDDRIAAAEKAK